MPKPARHRPMRRSEYQQAIAQLKLRHPWLVRQVVEPAPGHLAVFAHFLTQCEQLMRPADFRKRALLCVTAVDDELMVRLELAHVSAHRDLALVDILDQARLAGRQSCPVCGAPVPGRMPTSSRGWRCVQHQGVAGLFAEDVRRHRQSQVEQGALAPVSSAVAAPNDATAPKTMTAAPEALPHSDSAASAEGLANTGSTSVALYDPAGLKCFVDRHRPKGDDKLRRALSIEERMRAAGGALRPLGLLPEDWHALLDEFGNSFPNFAELVDLLRDHFALSALGDCRLSWPPVLLVGPAGIGKTEAARWLSERLALPFRVLDMASVQSSSTLAGSETFWSNSEPGQVFELLAYQPKANPVLVLDELDKVDQDMRYDPMGPLYSLLEPRSAQSFTDQSIRDFSVDASHVNWIATANSVEPIPAPIRSRLTVLQVSAPTAGQLECIAQSIYGRLRAQASWGEAFEARLEAEVLTRLGELSPRALAISLRRALGAAARAGRQQITADDLPRTPSSTSRGIGFMADIKA